MCRHDSKQVLLPWKVRWRILLRWLPCPLLAGAELLRASCVSLVEPSRSFTMSANLVGYALFFFFFFFSQHKSSSVPVARCKCVGDVYAPRRTTPSKFLEFSSVWHVSVLSCSKTVPSTPVPSTPVRYLGVVLELTNMFHCGAQCKVNTLTGRVEISASVPLGPKLARL